MEPFEPRIEYTKTTDGVNVAFWVLGGGIPLIHTPWAGVSHCEVEWLLPGYREWYDSLAAASMLVRYDGRGTGLSDRGVRTISIETHVSDLEAVAQAVGISRFAIFAALDSGTTALTYAAKHPEKVTHLILWCCFPSAAYLRRRVTEFDHAIMNQDWVYYTNVSSELLAGVGTEEAREAAIVMRAAVTRHDWRKIQRVTDQHDVADLLPQIQAPALVIHRPRFDWVSPDAATELESRIPNAEAMSLEGESGVPVRNEVGRIARRIGEFLGARIGTLKQTYTAPIGIVVLMYADIVNSTALTEKMGDTKFHEAKLKLYQAMARIVDDSGGEPQSRNEGDAKMFVFASAMSAINAALKCSYAGEERGLPLRVGIHAGDVLREASGVSGGTPNIVARIADQAEPGEVLASEAAREAARTSTGIEFIDRGERTLKGVSDPMRVWALRDPGSDA